MEGWKPENIEKWEIYLVPGMGTDSRLFEHFDLSPAKTIHLELADGGLHRSIPKMAEKIAKDIQPTRPFAFAGVSMGGMIATELSQIFEPDALILISSAKNRHEIPNYYRFFKYVPVHYLIPEFALGWGVEVMARGRKRERKKLLKEMLKETGAKRLKAQMDAVLRWENRSLPEDFLHIHGTSDWILPSGWVKDAEKVKGVGHELIFTQPRKIRSQIFEYLDSRSGQMT